MRRSNAPKKIKEMPLELELNQAQSVRKTQEMASYSRFVIRKSPRANHDGLYKS